MLLVSITIICLQYLYDRSFSLQTLLIVTLVMVVMTMPLVQMVMVLTLVLAWMDFMGMDSAARVCFNNPNCD